MPASPTPTSPKPTLPPFWKALMRVTFAVTMALFLAPTVYMVKYYAVDKPRENKIVKNKIIKDGYVPALARIAPYEADYLPYMEYCARTGAAPVRLRAVYGMGDTLLQPYISVQRPFECLSAKATLADLATKDPDLSVRAAASEELGKVAQGGAVIRR